MPAPSSTRAPSGPHLFRGWPSRAKASRGSLAVLDVPARGPAEPGRVLARARARHVAGRRNSARPPRVRWPAPLRAVP
eukprot:165280-Pyramimonas_sp.AAC.1